MKRFALPLMATALLAGAAYGQTDETPVNQPAEPTPAAVFADADGDGIANYADDDFVRPGKGRGNGPGQFVDEDGDGINDLAPDADGDGIVNHLDEDYERVAQGQGNGQGGSGQSGSGMRGRRGVANGPGSFVDADGDGVNDLAPDTDGDGVINHLDADYERPGAGGEKATGSRGGRGQKGGRK